MKKCNYCGTAVEDSAKFCTACGSSNFAENIPPVSAQPQPAVQPQQSPVDINDNGNILAGVVGAFLLSIVGAFLYFIIYQAGFIAGICGLVIFVLANFGYGLFAKTKNKVSLVALITSIVVSVVMIFVAEYVSVAYAVYEGLQDYGMSFWDSIQLMPEILEDSEAFAEFVKELGMAYLLCFIASIGSIVNVFKARKNSK